ncbi:MAG: hydroxyacid dehydrogenase [Ruminococcaceae bacterium]|nr:hydroxyacid dehydrogenase [Oscillospiraceae bacterium]
MNILVAMPKGEVRDSFLTPTVLAKLESLGTVTYNEMTRQYTRDELKKALRDCDIVVIGWGVSAITGDVIKDNDRLKLIVHTAGSVADYVDATTYEKGIRVICGNRLFAESVAEGTIAYMLSVLRYIPDQVYGLKNGGWRDPAYAHDRGLLGKQIGILGVGTIARYLMEMLQPFRCSFLVWDDNYTVDPAYLASVHARQTSLEEVVSSCPIVTLHASLTEKSRGMIGRRELEMMPRGGIFINTSRGAILREAEIAALLEERQDLHAMLDVFEAEPLCTDSPFRKLKNVYLMPHRGGPTVDYRATVGMTVVEEIERYLAGAEVLEHEIVQSVAARMTKHN